MKFRVADCLDVCQDRSQIKAIERFQAKWTPVRVKKTRQKGSSGSRTRIHCLAYSPPACGPDTTPVHIRLPDGSSQQNQSVP
jgi:hypothetical protein